MNPKTNLDKTAAAYLGKTLSSEISHLLLIRNIFFISALRLKVHLDKNASVWLCQLYIRSGRCVFWKNAVHYTKPLQS